MIATLATEGRDPGRRRHHRHRRPRHLPAGRGPPRQGAVQPAGRVGLRPLRRGRDRGAHRGDAGPLPAVRRPAGRPVGQPAGRARRGGEDGGQADQHLRRPRRHLRPPRRAVAEAAAEPGRRRSRSCGPERRRHPARPRRAGRGRPRTRLAVGGWDLEELRRLFDFLEFRTLWDRFIEAHGDGESGGRAEAGRAGRRPRGRRRGAWPDADGRHRSLHQAGRGRGPPWRWPAPWEGRERALAAARAGVRRAPGPGDGPGRGGLDRRRRCSATPRCEPPWASWSASDGVDVSRPRRQSPDAGPVAARASIFSHLELDTAIAAYLVDPAGDQYLLEDLALRYAGIELRAPTRRPPASWT